MPGTHNLLIEGSSSVCSFTQFQDFWFEIIAVHKDRLVYSSSDFWIHRVRTELVGLTRKVKATLFQMLLEKVKPKPNWLPVYNQHNEL